MNFPAADAFLSMKYYMDELWWWKGCIRGSLECLPKGRFINDWTPSGVFCVHLLCLTHTQQVTGKSNLLVHLIVFPPVPFSRLLGAEQRVVFLRIPFLSEQRSNHVPCRKSEEISERNKSHNSATKGQFEDPNNKCTISVRIVEVLGMMQPYVWNRMPATGPWDAVT